MSKKVVSIRLSPQTLAGVYDFLEIVCTYDTRALPVSTATQVALDAIVAWFQRKGELPTYATEEEAIIRIASDGRAVPSAYLPDTAERMVPMPQAHQKRTPQQMGAFLRDARRAKQECSERVIVQNLTNYSSQEQSGVPIEKKESMINLIDRFMERNEEDVFKNMLSTVKEDKLYREEEV